MSSERPKIICIDDDPSVLKALERTLEKHFQVLSCGRAAEALKLLREHPDTAVILADLRLPETSGLELLQTVRQISPNTVRAILSGQIDLKDMMAAVNQAQIDRFILKPWDNDYLEIQMLEALQTHLLLIEKSQLQHLAITDTVTGLRNHRYFQEVIRREIERSKRHSRPLSLLMIDIDHFKRYNDRHGHLEGDKALALVGQTLSAGLRSVDTVARYGGEEFAIVLPETDLAQASEVAERLRKAVERLSLPEPSGERKLTISLGIAHFGNNQTPEDLIKSADDALYRAKAKGRNRSVTAE